jgi:2-C-methyl-D-erythritol 4-phosphate cytidylyltransferase
VQYYVIIAAGGTGKRMNTAVPKQFLEIGSKPVIVHTIEKFISALPDAEFIVSMHSDWFAQWDNIKESLLNGVKILTINGGVERYHSVKNALSMINDDGIVCIHDAARPLLTKELILNCLQECAMHNTAVPATTVQESLRFVSQHTNIAVNRNEYRLIQTPQCFKSSIIKQAYQQEYNPNFTDDASVVEAAGFKIHLTEGERTNIKITTQQDIEFAACLISKL